MASEIRVDKINSLSGVGTVTLSPTGVDIAGITTAATLRATTGIVTSLTTGSLTSLGAVSGTTGTFSGAVSGTTGTFTGDVDIADKIVHTGDTNTAIRFPDADTVSVETGGSERLRIDSSGRLLFGINSSISGIPIQIASGYIQQYVAGNNADPGYFDILKTRNAAASGNTILQDGDQIGQIRFRGNTGSGYVNGALIRAVVNGTPGSGNDLPTDLQFHTMPDGSGSTSERLRITSDGDMGLGTASPESKFAIKGTSGQQDLFSISDTTVPTSGGEYGVAMIKTNTSNRALNVTNYNTAGIGVRIYTNGGASGRDCLQCYQAGGTRFIVNEDVTVSTGNLVIGTAGKGIDFSATGDSSGTMSSELLDDYEEGTFTPTSNATLSSADGSYTKIGRQVTVHIRIQTGSSGSGSQFVVSGMPFSASMPSGLSNGSVPCGFGYISGSVYNGGVQLHMVRDGTNLYFFNFGTSLTIANLASRDMRFGLVYHTAT